MNPIVDILGGPLVELGGKIIDRIWPDKEKQAAERQAAQLAIMQMQMDGDFRVMQQRMAAILAEANSQDPWTSRARPSFLYVMYVMILASLPMGILYAFQPAIAMSVADGMQAWLKAIPTELYTLFGVGYTGYTVMKGIEGRRGK